MKRGFPFFASLPIYLLLLAGCGKEPAPAAADPAAREVRPALTYVVGAAASGSSNLYSGEVRARYETQLGFRIGGKIVARMVDAGARVQAGQVLMRLDPEDPGLQASSAQAQYQLALEEAKRYRELRAQNFVSQSALDAKEVALKAAAAQAGLAGNQADYTTLRADHAGVIAATMAEVGQVVGAGQPVLRLAQDGEREVAIAVPETQFTSLKVGMPARITLWSAGNDAKHFNGKLRELVPAADPVSRTYAARVTLSDAGNSAPLGMTAQVSFGSTDPSGELLVPLSSIYQQGDQDAVWIVAQDGSVSLRPVRIASWRDEGAVIAGGLAAGERIVKAGVHQLHAGEKIRIIDGAFANGSDR